MSTITNGIQKGVISRISVEANANGKRFVISILVMATTALTGAKAKGKALADKAIALLAQLDAKNEDGSPKIANDSAEYAAIKKEYDEMLPQSDAIAKDIATLKDEPARYEYFSTPLSSPESVRINAQQLRNAFPELMGVNPDDAVFMKMLTNRSRFVNRDISFSVTPQVDKVTKAPKLDPKTNRPYTNVRIEASGEDMSEQDALALLSGAITTPNTDGVPAGDHNDDIPM